MKTRKKLLIALLSATCLTAGAFGLAACGEAEPQPDPNLYAIYNQYVASLPEGEEAKSYQDWLSDKLASVAQPGKPGETGKDAYEIYVESLPADATVPSRQEWLASLIGQAGAAGVTPHIGENGNWYLGETDTGVKAEGADGLGVESVTWNEDKTGLLITFDNGTSTTVTLPAEVTHVHTLGQEVKVIIPATGETEGIGYKTCTAEGCEHIELVTIGNYSYKVTVSYSDIDFDNPYAVGTLVSGATVTLKDGETVVATAVTDENGEAIFNDVERGQYAIVVTKEGYLSVSFNNTQEDVYDYINVLATLPADGDGTEEDAYQITSNLDSEVYFILAPEDADSSNAYITFTASKAGIYNFAEMMGAEFDPYYASNFTARLDENESVSFSILNYGGEGYFGLVVAYEEAERGTEQVPVAFKPGEQVTYAPEDAEAYTYFKLNAEAAVFNVTVGDGTELHYLGTSVDGNQDVELSSDFELDCSIYPYNKAFYFKAKGSEISFKLDYVEGEKLNPYTVELNESKTVTVGAYVPGTNASKTEWFKFTVDADATYVIESQASGFCSATIFDDLSSYTGTDIAGTISYEFKAGTYYISAGGYNYSGEPVTISFKIREAQEDDFAKIASMPVVFKDNTATVNVIAQNVYVVYEASEDGFVTFSAENGSVINYYTDPAFSEEEYTFYQYGDFALSAGGKLYLRINTSGTNGEVLTANFIPATTTATYTVNVSANDESVVNGVTVKISDGTNEYSATVTDGVATFENKPAGHYDVSIEISEGSDLALSPNSNLPKLSFVNKEASVTLIKSVEYTFTLDIPESITLPSDVEFLVATGLNPWSTEYGTLTLADFENGATLKIPYGNTFYVYVLQGYDEYEVEGFEFSFNEEGTTVTIELNEVTPPVDPDRPDVPNPWVVGTTEPISVTANEKYEFTATANTTYTFTVSGGSFYTLISGSVNYVVNGVVDDAYGSWLDNVEYDGDKIVSITYTLMEDSEAMTIIFTEDAQVTVTVE